MVLSSILSYSFIMLVLYICSVFASRKYAMSMRKGISKTPFISPEVVFFIAFFTISFAIRYNVGVDFVNYLDEYESGYKLEYGKNAPIYKYIALTWSNLGAHPAFYFGTFVFIQITFFLLYFKNERFLYPFFVVFLFCNGEVQDWMNIIRSTAAMCIWLYSIKYIEERKFWKYLIAVLVAAGFHRVAFLYIVLYPFLTIKEIKLPSIFFQYVVLGGALIIRKLFVEFAGVIAPIVNVVKTTLGGEEDLYASYDVATMLGDINRAVTGTGIAFIVKLIIDAVIISYSNKMHQFYNCRKFNILYILFIISLFVFYCFPDYVISFSRPFRFFFVFRTIMLGYFAYYLWKHKSKNGNELLLIATMSIYIGLFILAQVVCNENSCLWYQTWFNQ